MTLLYTRFCAHVGITLEPGQYVACSVAFDGVDPCDLSPPHREIAREIFGNVDRFTPQQRRVFAAVCGGRAGKTRLFTAMRLLHLGLTFDLSQLAPGEAGYGMIVAPQKMHGWQALAYIRGIVMESPVLAARVLVDNKDELTIDRNGRHVTWLVTGAAARGNTQRGKSMFGASLEEAAFFRDEKTGVVNDQEIYDAIEPRVMTGGQVIIPSTPWAEVGLLYDFYARNHGHPVDAMAAHAATLTLRSDPEIRARIEAMLTHPTKRANALREFGAEFMLMGASTFFDKSLVEAALRDDAYILTPGDILASGGDLGFVKNSSACATTARRGSDLWLASLLEKLPGKGTPLRPSDTVKSFAADMARFGVRGIVSDGHYRETMREHLTDAGMHVLPAPEGSEGKTDSYGHLRDLLLEGRLLIPRNLENVDRLVQQLVDIKAKPLAGGTMSFSSPTWTDGAHGDLAAALILSAYPSYGVEVAAPPKPEDAAEARARRHEEKSLRPEKKGLGAWSRY